MTNYQLDHERKTINISEKFKQKASNLNRVECRTLSGVKEMFPDYGVQVVKSQGKKTFKNLTFAVMELYVRKLNNQTDLEAFYKVKNYYAGETARYAKVKAWFLHRYPDISTELIDYLKKATDPLEVEAKRMKKIYTNAKGYGLASDVLLEIDEANARLNGSINTPMALFQPATSKVVYALPPAIKQETTPS